MKANYVIIILVLLVFAGICLVKLIPFGKDESSILSDQAVLFTSLLPKEVAIPNEVSAEFVVPFTQNVSGNVRPVVVPPGEVPQPVVKPVEGQQPAPTMVLPLSSSSVSAPVSVVYFYTGVPVRSAAPIVVYTGVSVPAVTPVPVAQSFVMPVFVPQIVPSRVGMPKWVYSNGVVIKPKVYYPNQPVRNSFRAVTL